MDFWEEKKLFVSDDFNVDDIDIIVVFGLILLLVKLEFIMFNVGIFFYFIGVCVYIFYVF